LVFVSPDEQVKVHNTVAMLAVRSFGIILAGSMTSGFAIMGLLKDRDQYHLFDVQCFITIEYLITVKTSSLGKHLFIQIALFLNLFFANFFVI
jgi:hypothetical protein